MTVRGGLISTLPFSNSYYTGDTLETNLRTVTESTNWIEPYVGYQHRYSTPKTFDVYHSVDIRAKTIYNYSKAHPDDKEDRQLSFNAIVGVALQSGDSGPLGNSSLFVRAYRGVNPHGQFRNMKDFWLWGVELRLDR